MTAQKFDQIVEARANERVQERITTFCQEVAQACNRVVNQGRIDWDPTNSGKVWHGSSAKKFLAVLQAVVQPDSPRMWPKFLWEQEREAVTKELLGTLDELSKAMIAAGRVPNPNDAVPAE